MVAITVIVFLLGVSLGHVWGFWRGWRRCSGEIRSRLINENLHKLDQGAVQAKVLSWLEDL